jgi:hypothetical protein
VVHRGRVNICEERETSERTNLVGDLLGNPLSSIHEDECKRNGTPQQGTVQS